MKYKYLILALLASAFLNLTTSMNCFAATKLKYFYNQDSQLEWLMYQDTNTSLFTSGYHFYYSNKKRIKVESIKITPGNITPEFPFLTYQVTNLITYNSSQKIEWSINYGEIKNSTESYGPLSGYNYTYDLANGVRRQRDYVKFYYNGGYNNNYGGPTAVIVPVPFGYSFDKINSESYDEKGRIVWKVRFGYVQNIAGSNPPGNPAGTSPIDGENYSYHYQTGKLVQKDFVKFYYNGGYNNNFGGPAAVIIPVPYGYGFDKTNSESYDEKGRIVWKVRFGYVQNIAGSNPSGNPAGTSPIDGENYSYHYQTGKLVQKDFVKFHYSGGYNNISGGPIAANIPVPYDYAYDISKRECYDSYSRIEWNITFDYLQSIPIGIGPKEGHHYVYTQNSTQIIEEFVRFYYSYGSTIAPGLCVPYGYSYDVIRKTTRTGLRGRFA